jgi:recombination protein RecT
MTSALKQAVRGEGQQAKQAPASFPVMLNQFKNEIAKALPRHLSAERMARIALTAFRRSPALGNCAPSSVFAAVIQASQLGLEPDTLGRAYLIPYGNECQFVPGWKGLVDLVNRAGNASVWSGVVYAGETLDYQRGDSPHLKVTGFPNDPTPENITHFWAVGRVKGSEFPVIECWSAEQVRRHRDRYNKVGKRHYSFENWEMYARKVVLLQVLKYMPASPELAKAMTLNDQAEIGEQHLTIDDAIEGDFTRAVDTNPQAKEKNAPEAPETPAPGKNTGKTEQKITFAQVADAINRSTALDTLDVAADLIGAVDVPEQRAELSQMFKAKKAELEQVQS